MPTSTFDTLSFHRLIQSSLLLLIALLTGCEQHEEISSYTVPTHESLQTQEFLKVSAERKSQPARMLAAIIPDGGTFWFFKLQGPPDAVTAREQEFRDVLKSVTFSAGGPSWKLPDKWKEEGRSEMRFATLVPPGEPRLEVAVSFLPVQGNPAEFLLSNVNRWRNQLDLPFIQLEDVPSRTEKIEAGGLTITLVNIAGKVRPKPAMPAGMPPMIRPEAAKPAEGPADDEPDIKYDKPAEWTEVPPKMFTIAAFEATQGKKKVTITLSRAGGSKAANINRWRGQLGMTPLPEDEAIKSLKKIEVGSRSGELVELKSETQTMLGLMIPHGDQNIFVKLTGDPDLAVKERARFDAFANSLKF